MADRNKITAKDFFTGAMLSGFLIGFLGIFVICVTIFLSLDNTEEVNMRKTLYSEISGDTLPESSIDDPKILNVSRYFADHLKAKTKKGKSVKDIVGKSEFYRQIFDHTAETNKMQEVLLSGLPEDTTEIVMGRNSAWHEIAKDPKSQNALEALLKGDKNQDFASGEANPVANFIDKNILFLLIIFSQMGAVWGFMYYVSGSYYEKKWFDLPWGKLGTYVFILFLFPGALVPAFFAASKTIFVTDLSKAYREIKEKKREKKLAKEKEIALKFDKMSTGLVSSRKDSEALLEKLELKLRKEKAGA